MELCLFGNYQLQLDVYGLNNLIPVVILQEETENNFIWGGPPGKLPRRF
jgi:hypothetical protein